MQPLRRPSARDHLPAERSRAALFVPAPLSPAAGTAINVRNAVLIGGGILALLLVLEEGPDGGWTASPTLGLIAAAVVLLALYTLAELRADAESGTHDGDAGIAVLARAVVASCHGNFLIA